MKIYKLIARYKQSELIPLDPEIQPGEIAFQDGWYATLKRVQEQLQSRAAFAFMTEQYAFTIESLDVDIVHWLRILMGGGGGIPLRHAAEA